VITQHHVITAAIATLAGVIVLLAILWVRALSACDALRDYTHRLTGHITKQDVLLTAHKVEIARLNNRCKAVTNELRGSDDMCQTMVLNNALPHPEQWEPEPHQDTGPGPRSSGMRAAAPVVRGGTVRVMGVRL
jgi:hypothetical protein